MSGAHAVTPSLLPLRTSLHRACLRDRTRHGIPSFSAMSGAHTVTPRLLPLRASLHGACLRDRTCLFAFLACTSFCAMRDGTGFVHLPPRWRIFILRFRPTGQLRGDRAVAPSPALRPHLLARHADLVQDSQGLVLLPASDDVRAVSPRDARSARAEEGSYLGRSLVGVGLVRQHHLPDGKLFPVPSVPASSGSLARHWGEGA